MTIKYHVAHDGNQHGLFNSLESAEKYIVSKEIENNPNKYDLKGLSVDAFIGEHYDFWVFNRQKYGTEFFDNLWQIADVEFNEDGEIIKIYGESFDEKIEEWTGNEIGSSEFQDDKTYYIGYFTCV